MTFIYYIQYIIKLKKKIDYFEDLIPICISNKHMLSFCDNDNTKICVYGFNNFIKYKNKDLDELFLHCNNYFIEKDLDLNFYEIRKNKTEKCLLYNDVFFYSKHIKGLTIEMNTKEQYNEIKTNYLKMFEILKNNDFNTSLININEYRQLIHDITIQIIIYDGDYLQKIIDIEKTITNFELNEEMTKLKNNILLHEKINDLVVFDGFEITKIPF